MRFHCCYAIVVVAAVSFHAGASPLEPKPVDLNAVNAKLHGRMIDHTHNHGCDRRIWSAALGQKRDMYVYVPPGYDGLKQFPVMIWFHGFAQDERAFFDLAELFDGAVAQGAIPPTIIVIPDGAIKGKPTFFGAGSFFLNSRAGCFEYFIVQDVWPFVKENYRIRPEREAHVLAGPSMGGFSAINLGIKYRDQFQGLAGIMPLINMRYSDCHGNHKADFDPDCYSLAPRYRPLAVSGRIDGIPIRFYKAMHPLYKRPSEVEKHFPLENPVEMLEPYQVKPGELRMFLSYGTCDSFNCDAQVESFLHEARRLGLGDDCTKVVVPGAKHGLPAGKKMFGPLAEWLTVQLRAFTPAPAKAAAESK